MDRTGLQRRFEELTSRGDFAGTALVWREGVPIFEYAGGLAHRGLGVPNTGETRFAVASISKLPTAIACLRLVDRGLLSLDLPLAEILPRGQHPTALTREVTLHHVLSHTSGLANYHDDADPTWASFTANWDRIPTYHVRRPADMLPAFADLPARFRPGERYEYNDAGFILAGLAIEAVTGRPYDEIVAEEVFAPAGMANTAIEALDHEPARMATGYMTDETAARGWKSNVFSVTAMGMPDGGVITTARDLALLIDALLGGRLLSPALLAAMTTPQGPPDASEAYGYGCMLRVEDGRVATIGHGGSDPGVSTLLVHHLASATTIVTICNQDRGGWIANREIQVALGLLAQDG
ncbi:MAG TPA: serine hydrolase domain-containing protein [Candidatus Limnocylindrales bacterium]|nr:serine hydrolase domain-containing protein [Candidatus Limnocylindrales bacterium]